MSLAQTIKANRLENLKSFRLVLTLFQDFETRTSFHEDYSYGRNVPRDFDNDDCSKKSSFFSRQLNVDHFDDESAELADYLSHFERVAKWNGWSHEEKGIHLALNLRGAAQQVLGYLTDFEDDYDVLCPVLKKRFCPVPMYRSEFRNRKKFNGESVSDFGFSLSCLLYTSPSPRDSLKSRMPSSA